MTIVADLFENDGAVQKAVDELKRHKFGQSRVWVIGQSRVDLSPKGSNSLRAGPGNEPDQTLTGLGVPLEEARFYAEGIKRGGQVVVVQTSGERAAEARKILFQAHTEETRF